MVYDIIFSDNFDHAFKNTKIFNTSILMHRLVYKNYIFTLRSFWYTQTIIHTIRKKTKNYTPGSLRCIRNFVIVYSPNSKPSFSPFTHIMKQKRMILLLHSTCTPHMIFYKISQTTVSLIISFAFKAPYIRCCIFNF